MCNQTTIATPEISEFTLQTPEILYPVKDDSYKLTGETRTGTHAFTSAYTYDNVGNRITQTCDGVTMSYVYNNRDQLTSEDSAGVVTTYTYDAAGRMTGKTVAGVITTYGWEDNDRMVSVNGPGGAIRYVYDHNGQRVRESTASDTVCYLIDYQLPYGQVVAETDGEGIVVATYVYGLDRLSQNRNSILSTYQLDGQGSIRALTNSSGSLTDQYWYTAFGEELAKTGSTENRFRYVGEQWDANAGWYYNRARWYSPDQGRFTSVDPYGGDPQAPVSLHRYLYCGNDPISNIDPSGASFLSAYYGVMRTTIDVVYKVAIAVRLPAVMALLMKASYWTFTHSVQLEFYAASVGLTLEVVSLGADAIINNTEAVPDNPGDFITQKMNANSTGYEVIDDLRNNQATSIKSIQTNSMERVLRNIEEQAKEVGGHKSDWQPRQKGGVAIPSQNNIRGLVYVIPETNSHFLHNKVFISEVRRIAQATKVVINVIPLRNWVVKK